MQRGASMKASLDAGRPILSEEVRTLAYALGGGIWLDNKLTFAMCRTLLDDLLLLSESKIAAGNRHAYENPKAPVPSVSPRCSPTRSLDCEGRSHLCFPAAILIWKLHRRVVTGMSYSLGGEV